MATSRNERPNIVYVCSDQHSHRFTGYAGHPLVQTPHMDRIAERGVTFSNAYCGSPVCVPGRACLMTGMYASDCNSFCNSTVWDGSHPTWGTLMGEAGYPCYATGKFDLNLDYEMGFEMMEVTNGHCRNPDITSLFRRPLLGYREGSRAGMVGSIREEPHRDGKVASIGVDFIRDQSPKIEGPWLLYAGFTQPHSPFQCLQRHFDLYPLDQIDLPDVSEEKLEALHPVYQMRRSNPVSSLPLGEDRLRRIRAAYYGMITELDEYIGDLMDALEATGQLENTVFIYTSDHGEALGEHDQWGKSTMFEGAAHIPLVMAGPGLPVGSRVDTPVAHVDLVPTMLEVAGALAPDQLRGHSLMPLIRGEAGNHPGFTYTENHSGGNITGSFMIRKGDWKYIHFTWYDDLLFNLAEDPGEHHNRAKDPNVQDVLKELRNLLLSQVDPEEVTRRAFEVQDRFLKQFTAERSEVELAAAFEGRMGAGLARAMAVKCKSDAVG